MAGSALTAFAPCGAMRLSSRPTYGEMFFRQLLEEQQVQGADGAFDSSWNSYNSCRLYAIAMAMQTCQLQLDHAFNQRDPRYCTEKLPELEADYQIIPLPSDTIAQRRLNLAAAMALKDGNLYTAIIAGLSAILGTSISVRALASSEVTAVLVGQTALQSFDRFGTDYKLVTTTQPVTATGNFTVGYSQLGGSGADLVIGDKLVFDVNCNGRTEIVTTTGATSSTLTAVFVNGHDSGAIATTNQWPAWVSNKRHLLVFVDDTSVFNNASLLTRVNNFLDYALRGSSTWSIVPDVAGVSPKYTIETSLTDFNTIEDTND